MAIAPWVERFCNSVLQRNEIVKRSAAYIVLAAHSRFRQVAVTVPAWIVALAIEVRVLGIGKRRCMQAMCCMKWHLQSQENNLVSPRLRKKVVALLQAN